MIQIISISFQISGAVILLLWCLRGAKIDHIIEKCFPGSNTVSRDDNNNCILSKERLQKAAREVYTNVLAFVDLIIGYLTTYFITDTLTPVCASILTIFITAVLIAINYIIAWRLSIWKYPNDVVVSYSVLEKHNVDTIITNKEIEDLWNSPSDSDNT